MFLKKDRHFVQRCLKLSKKSLSKFSVSMLAIVFVFTMLESISLNPNVALAASAPVLGEVSSFAVLAGSGIVSANPPQVIVGDAGSNPTVSNGLTNAEVTGTNYTAANAAVIAAKVDLAIAYTNISTQPQSGADIPSELAAQTLSPGVYHSASGVFGISGAGVLTLDGGGDPNAVFIIKADSTLTTAVGSSVVLINGAQARNVFWAVGTSATLEGTTFVGTIMAVASITDSGNSNVLGRFLADADNNGNGAVTLNSTEITAPTSLTLNKILINDNGGLAVEANWNLTATGPSTISGPGAAGSTDVVSGGTFTAGAYTLSESAGPAGYIASAWSCIKNGGAPVAGSSITIETGDIVTCTITNNDIAPAPPAPATLHIVKTVINDNGGTAVASAFTINVAGTNVSDPSFAGSAAGTDITLDAGAYAVTEPVVPAGYLQTGSGNCSGTILAGETKTCTITNNDIAPQLIVNKIVINDNGRTKLIANFPLFIDAGSVTSGVANSSTIGLHTVSETSDAGYTAVVGGNCAANGTITLALGDVKTCTITNNDIASVVVSGGGSGGGSFSPPAPVPPLIDLVKTPSPLALPEGAGPITYTYTLSNVGTVPVGSITMVGDTCSPIVRVSGDTDGDEDLDVNETWIYSCSTTLSETHTNIVTAIGWANGISATDIANATVIVGIPVVPPLIHVTKVPSPLTLLAEGGMVTYTNRVTNPGTEPLSNVQLSDDKCGPVNYISGDINNDSKLDVTETWTYSCKTELTETTVNTITASGEANGLTASDFSIATVIVSASGVTSGTVSASASMVAPKLPNTGIGTDEKSLFWTFVTAAGLFTLWISFYFVRRKQL